MQLIMRGVEQQKEAVDEFVPQTVREGLQIFQRPDGWEEHLEYDAFFDQLI